MIMKEAYHLHQGFIFLIHCAGIAIVISDENNYLIAEWNASISNEGRAS